jgi:uncharacterized protein (TIGR02391 family)
MEEKGIIQELGIFLHEFQDYYYTREKIKQGNLGPQEQVRFRELRRTLVKKSGKHKELIHDLTGINSVPIIINNKEMITDIWTIGLLADPVMRTPIALGYCIDAVGQAIGKLEDEVSKGIRDKQGNKIVTENITSINIGSPIQLFDAMQFHHKVVESSKSCFIASNYRESILNVFISLTDYIKEKTRLKTDNKDLMAKAFDLDNPVIQLNSLIEQYERDEQEGFRFLYMGAAVGIRNPKAHKLIPQTNPYHTLEYLALASLLFRRIDEGKIKPIV